MTANGKPLKNVFVKSVKRINGKVNRVILEAIHIMTEEEGKNW